MMRAQLSWSLAVFVLALPIPVYSNGNEPPPVSTTGGFGENTCVECHVDGANPSSGRLTLEAPATYTPGSTVPILVIITDTGSPQRRAWGFELAARFNNRSQAGTLAAGDANSTVRTANWLGFNIQYASHRVAIRQPGISFTFTVNWTAPPDASAGEVIFHAAGNAANGDLQNTGDRIYSAEVRSAAPAPAVGAGGLVSAASFQRAPNNQVAGGQLISIFGTNLTRGGPHQARELPLTPQLGPTRVKVGTLDVPLIFVSSEQINAQLPFEVATTGAQPLVVTVIMGTNVMNSAPENVSLAAASPALFTIPPAGTGNGAILHGADFTLVDSASPARPGEVVLMFGTGLGAVDPPVSTGAGAPTQPPFARTTSPVTVTIGGQPARVDFSGLAPGFAGLYQLNVVVPMVSGSAEVRITAGTATSPSGVTMPVAQ